MGLGGIVKKVFTSVKLKKRVFDPEKVSIEDIVLPKIIRNLGADITISMVKEEITTYNSLGYKDKSIETLERKVYHSFQIGIILKYLQLDLSLTGRYKKDIYPDFVHKLQFEALQTKVFDIIDMYDKNVKKDLVGAQLINEIEWTPLDATYLLYYLTIYKDKKV